KKQGLEIVALDEVNERYTLFDIPTTSSSIAQALREETEELVFQWMHPEQSDIEETRQKWTKWIIENIVPYCGNPFEKTEALGFMVEEKGKWYGLMMQVPLQKLGVASKADALILNVKIHPEDKEQLIAHDGIYEAYHMNKKHWISIALNVCSDDALVKECIYTSYKCVAKKDNSLLSTRDSL
ncbi:MAG: MmcQ/YjbR family DNA-binding protein, partial [Streptococcus sp.]|nr:MmcQ/YjbR family DNA-binding protein [Streptococcus sp.]